MIKESVHPLSMGEARKRLQAARQSESPRQIAEAAARLGFLLFQKKRFSEGVPLFEEAVATARKLSDQGLLILCLELKSQAYHGASRLPDAFQAAREIAELAQKSGDQALQCDALTSQGQILLDSGEPVIAGERLLQAQKIARELSDTRRQMQVLGVLGNYGLAVANLDQAAKSFSEAGLLAHLLDNRQAEIGYLGNEAAVLVWQGRHLEALPMFEQVLAYAKETKNIAAELHALRFLAQIYQASGDESRFEAFARKGLDLARQHDARAALAFLEMLVPAAYRKQNLAEGDALSLEAIDLAHKLKERSKEFRFLVSLGESYLANGNAAGALEIYPKARLTAKRLEHSNDEAYLTGRIGVALAELGRLDEAKESHLQALEEARKLGLPALEGEQLSMLALACREAGNLQEAQEYCRQAIDVFQQEGLEAQEANARALLDEIDPKREQAG